MQQFHASFSGIFYFFVHAKLLHLFPFYFYEGNFSANSRFRLQAMLYL